MGWATFWVIFFHKPIWSPCMKVWQFEICFRCFPDASKTRSGRRCSSSRRIYKLTRPNRIPLKARYLIFWHLWHTPFFWMGAHGTCLFTFFDARRPRCNLVFKRDKFIFFYLGNIFWLIYNCIYTAQFIINFKLHFQDFFYKKITNLLVQIWCLDCVSVARHRKTK
jgi:hypothetical protein